MRAVEDVPIEELALLLEAVVARHLGLARDDAFRVAAKALGFAAAGARVTARLQLALSQLVASKRVVQDGDSLQAG